MWQYNYDALLAPDELEHHGILGMRWGHRKQKVSSGNGSRQKKKVTDMSDEELNSNIERLRKEKEYKDLNNQVHPAKTKSGVSRALSNAMTTTVDVVATSLMVHAGKKLVSNLLSGSSSNQSSKNEAIIKNMKNMSVDEMKAAINLKETQSAYKKAMGYREEPQNRNFLDGIEWKKINKK